jgi:hypothetical protein
VLVEAGRGDLANAMRDHGGWVYYSRRLGLRHSFAVRSQGFWKSQCNVYKELLHYVARRYGEWDFPGRRADPAEAVFTAAGDGTAAAGEGKRATYKLRSRRGGSRRRMCVMPSVEMMRLDGRSDIAFAIHQYQGGEAAFAERHGLTIAADSNHMRPHEELARWRTFAREMRAWMDSHGCRGIMPSRSDLILTGRNDLRYAIYSHGGNVNVARRLELVSLDEENWVAKWWGRQAARLGLYMSLPPEKRANCAETGEETLPCAVKGGRAALDLANLRERRRHTIQSKGRVRAKRGRPAPRSIAARADPPAGSVRKTSSAAPLSDVEFEALRKRYAHLPPDDIIAP